MLTRLSTFRLLLGLWLLVVSTAAHADDLYTVNENNFSIPATSFSFTEPTIAASGIATTLTQISGATTTEFAWNSAAGGICLGASFVGSACASIIEEINLATEFAPGDFLAVGSYTSLAGDMSVTIQQITPATPEPSSLLLLGTGAVGLFGPIRRRVFPRCK